MEQLKIPKDRIPCLIGIKGKDKRQIEKLTKTKLKVDSKEGDIIIEGESLQTYICKSIIKAIARGFNPKIALQLLNENYILEIVNIEDFVRKTKNDLLRVRSRIIGTEGKARKMIERLTNTDICVYGKTVSIVGEQENVYLAKRAVINLLQGSKHGNVYNFIAKNKKPL
ncbi:MAG: KH domain-containing protein [Nanoarchaeota archaeon]|nr:KH domain-containing protein [Nanoarchaeota archaeon]